MALILPPNVAYQCFFLMILLASMVSGYEQPPYFQEYEDLLGSNYLKRCFKRPEPPIDGSRCGRFQKACLWGSQTCGVAEEPTTRCDCRDRVWACRAFSCPSIEPFCPAEYPFIPNPNPECKTDLSCPYGEQSCCGLTFATTLCSCYAGSGFSCDGLVNICSGNSSCPDVIAFANGDKELFGVPGIDGRDVLLAQTTTAPTPAPTPLFGTDEPAFAFARATYSTIYNSTYSGGFPLWTAPDMREELGIYNECKSVTTGLPCMVEVKSIFESSEAILGQLPGNTSEIVESTDISIFSFLGRLGGPNGQQEGWFLAWKAFGGDYQFIIVLDARLFSLPTEILRRRELKSESVLIDTIVGANPEVASSMHSEDNSLAPTLAANHHRRLSVVPSWCADDVLGEAYTAKCGGGLPDADPVCVLGAFNTYITAVLTSGFPTVFVTTLVMPAATGGCEFDFDCMQSKLPVMINTYCALINMQCGQLLSDVTACVTCQCCDCTMPPAKSCFGGRVLQPTFSGTGVADAHIQMFDSSGVTLIAETWTNVNGCYAFNRNGPSLVPDGIYVVRKVSNPGIWTSFLDVDGGDPDHLQVILDAGLYPFPTSTAECTGDYVVI